MPLCLAIVESELHIRIFACDTQKLPHPLLSPCRRPPPFSHVVCVPRFVSYAACRACRPGVFEWRHYNWQCYMVRYGLEVVGYVTSLPRGGFRVSHPADRCHSRPHEDVCGLSTRESGPESTKGGVAVVSGVTAGQAVILSAAADPLDGSTLRGVDVGDAGGPPGGPDNGDMWCTPVDARGAPAGAGGIRRRGRRAMGRGVARYQRRLAYTGAVAGAGRTRTTSLGTNRSEALRDH